MMHFHQFWVFIKERAYHTFTRKYSVSYISVAVTVEASIVVRLYSANPTVNTLCNIFTFSSAEQQSTLGVFLLTRRSYKGLIAQRTNRVFPRLLRFPCAGTRAVVLIGDPVFPLQKRITAYVTRQLNCCSTTSIFFNQILIHRCIYGYRKICATFPFTRPVMKKPGFLRAFILWWSHGGSNPAPKLAKLVCPQQHLGPIKLNWRGRSESN